MFWSQEREEGRKKGKGKGASKKGGGAKTYRKMSNRNSFQQIQQSEKEKEFQRKRVEKQKQSKTEAREIEEKAKEKIEAAIACIAQKARRVRGARIRKRRRLRSRMEGRPVGMTGWLLDLASPWFLCRLLGHIMSLVNYAISRCGFLYAPIKGPLEEGKPTTPAYGGLGPDGQELRKELNKSGNS